MRDDDKSHDLWLCGYVYGETNIITRQCDDCAADTDELPELDWRIPYRLITEREMMLRISPNIVAVR
jgi:hypothetical protein